MRSSTLPSCPLRAAPRLPPHPVQSEAKDAEITVLRGELGAAYQELRNAQASLAAVEARVRSAAQRGAPCCPLQP